MFKSKADRLFEKAKDAFRYRNGGDAAFAQIEQAAEMGSYDAKGFLMEYCTAPGSEYHDGAKGARACEDLIRKCDMPLAKFQLGRLYYWGDGVEQDFSKAYRLFSEAAGAKKYRAPQGNGYIGAMYFWGDGVPQSYEEAAKYITDRSTLTFCDHEGDVLYCYHYMRLYGLGGCPRCEKDAWENLLNISRWKDLSPRTRQACLNLICNHELDLFDKLVGEEHLNSGAIRLCLSHLRSISESGLFAASCAMAYYYLTHSVTHTRTLKNRETGEVEVLSERTESYDEEAGVCLKRVRAQLEHAPKEKRELKYAQLLLESSHKMDQLEPGLSLKLTMYVMT